MGELASHAGSAAVVLHHLTYKAFDTHLGVYSSVHRLLKVLAREGNRVAIVRARIEVSVAKCTDTLTSLWISPTFALSFLSLLQTLLTSFLNGHSFFVLEVAHLVKYVQTFAGFSTNQHKWFLIKFLHVAIRCGLTCLISLRVSLERIESLLWALKAERVGDADLFVTVQASAILLVTLILKLAGLETENLWQHHAYQLGQDSHFHILWVMHLVGGSKHECASFLRVMMHIYER